MAKFLYQFPLLKRYGGVVCYFLLGVMGVGFFLGKVEIPELKCRLNSPQRGTVTLVDLGERKKEIEELSPRAFFFGLRDRPVPKDLQLEVWEEMEYIEPVFIFP
ncbi:MAG: hypothetical protein LBN94_02440 [Puniceicoccales bacterium]|nr:hypothetical protein [Puniceicoccales bacterium]